MKDEANEHNLPENDKDLEALLKGLDPAALDVGIEAGLLRDFERVASRLEPSGSSYDPNHIQWRRVIPLTAVCCAVMFVLGYMKIRERLPEEVAAVPNEAVPALTLADESAVSTVPGVPADGSVDRFLPVSAQGYLIESSSGGVISTPDGPREKMNVKYGDAYHWHDPDTGTNIRFFQPRSEEIVVPLQTN